MNEIQNRRRALMGMKSGAKWDYEWSAKSGVLPQGMTVDDATWAADNEYVELKHPVYPIGYADAEVEIVCAWKTLPQMIYASNTQISVGSANSYAVKLYANTQGKIIFSGHQNGSFVTIQLSANRSDFHVYRLRLHNGACKCYLDGNLVTELDEYASQYNMQPIIATSDTSVGPGNRLALQSIKWRVG